MAANVETYIYTGINPGSGAALSSFGDNVRFNLADDNVQTTANPCIKPDAGSNYSFWKTIALYCSIAPDNYVNNVKLYTDGSNAWGASMPVKVGVASAYDQAVVDPVNAESGKQLLAANHAGMAAEPVDLFSYVNGAELSVPTAGTGAGGDFVPGDAPGRVCDFVVAQVEVMDTATGGTKAQQTITWRYDEA